MKKALSVLLSVLMLCSITAGIDFSAYAGAYDTMGTAISYTFGSTITGYFSSNDTVDFIKFTLPSSGRVNLILSGSESFDADIYNYDASYIHGFYAPYNSNLGKAYDDRDVVALTAGTYYLKVSGSSNENYSIRMNFTSANESFYESNTAGNDIIGNANPINLGIVYTGLLGYANDKVDFYSFTVPTGSYNINVIADKGIDYDVYTMNGNSVANFYAPFNSATGYAQDTDSISLNAGTYCIKLSLYSSYTEGALYNFSITAPHYHEYYLSGSVASTYTMQGYNVYTCSCGDWYAADYKPYKKVSKPTISKISSPSKGKIKTTWKKVKNASGYQIQYARNKKFTNHKTSKFVSAKSTGRTGTQFKSKTTYYVRVRAYKNVNGQKIYGSWSKVKTVKTK